MDAIFRKSRFPGIPFCGPRKSGLEGLRLARTSERDELHDRACRKRRCRGQKRVAQILREAIGASKTFSTVSPQLPPTGPSKGKPRGHETAAYPKHERDGAVSTFKTCGGRRPWGLWVCQQETRRAITADGPATVSLYRAAARGAGERIRRGKLHPLRTSVLTVFFLQRTPATDSEEFCVRFHARLQSEHAYFCDAQRRGLSSCLRKPRVDFSRC